MQIQNKTIDSRQSSSKLHTKRLIELRPFVDDNLRQKAESMLVCPLFCSLRNSYSHQDPHTTKKAHKCTFSVRGGCFFLLLKALPSSKFASQKHHARGQRLDRGSPVRGKSNDSLFQGLAGRQGGPLTYQSLICITPLQFREKRRRPSYPFIIFSDSGFCLLPAGHKSLVTHKYW